MPRSPAHQEDRLGRMTSRTSWIGRRAAWSAFCGLALALSVIGASIAWGFSGPSILRGALVCSLFLGWLVAAAEITAPRAFLRWRGWMMRDGPEVFDRVARVFDKPAGVDPLTHTDTLAGTRRVRAYGIVVLIATTVTVAVIWALLAAAHVI